MVMLQRTGIVFGLAMMLASSGYANPEPSVEGLLHAGRVSEALVAAESEIAANDSDLDAHERYIDILHTVGLSHRARAIYSGRVTKRPTAADAHYLFGRSINNPDEAISAYTKALSLNSGHARSHMGLASVKLATGDVEAAIRGYRLATEADATLGEAWQGWTRSLALSERVDEALSVARRAMVAIPTEAEPYLTVAVLQPNEALAVLAQGAKMVPHDPRMHARSAELLIEAGRASEAVAAAQRALAIDPALPDANRTLIFAQAMQAGVIDRKGYRGLLEAQVALRESADFGYAQFDALVSAYPKCALTWMGRSQSRLRLSHIDGARLDLEQAAALDPNNADIQAAYGLVLLRSSDAERAAYWLGKAADSRPNDVSVAVALGQAHIAAGEYETGISTLQQAYVRFSYDSRVALAYAEVLANKGELLAAYEVIREAFQRRPDSKLLVSLIAAARDVGRYQEAADLLEALGQQTGSQVLLDEAAKMRRLLEQP